jgi:hypothetical protein
MGNIKNCNRDQIPTPKQLPEILAQNPMRKIPKEIKRPSSEDSISIPICFGYRLGKDDAMYTICEKCPFNDEERIKPLIQYFLDYLYQDFKLKIKRTNPFFHQTARETARLIYYCPSRTWLNKILQTEAQFRKEQEKVINYKIENILKSLKNL